MGKCVKWAALLALLFAVLTVRAAALTDDGKLPDGFSDAIPYEARQQTGDVSEYDDIRKSAGFDTLVKGILSALKGCMGGSVALFLSASAIVLLFSVADALDMGKSSVKSVAAATATAAVLAACFPAVKSSTDAICESVESMKVFTTAAMPAVSALCISGGDSFSAAVFSAALSLSSGVFEYVTRSLLLPLTVLYMTIGAVGNVSDRYDILSVSCGIKKFVKWAAGVFMGIFTLSFSLQSFLSRASDTVVKRGIKSAVGSFIRVLGGTLSGGVDSMFTLAANSKTSLAVFGVIVILLIFLPPVLSSLCFGAAVSGARVLAGFLKVKKAEAALAGTADVFFVLAGICSACVYMVVLSFLLICVNMV